MLMVAIAWTTNTTAYMWTRENVDHKHYYTDTYLLAVAAIARRPKVMYSAEVDYARICCCI